MSRNPHDIGRRILPHYLFTQFRVFCGRNPHDIGRRILRIYIVKGAVSQTVAILMTLEGEYYPFAQVQQTIEEFRRNPHDIGRRILLTNYS